MEEKTFYSSSLVESSGCAPSIGHNQFFGDGWVSFAFPKRSNRYPGLFGSSSLCSLSQGLKACSRRACVAWGFFLHVSRGIHFSPGRPRALGLAAAATFFIWWCESESKTLQTSRPLFPLVKKKSRDGSSFVITLRIVPSHLHRENEYVSAFRGERKGKRKLENVFCMAKFPFRCSRHHLKRDSLYFETENFDRFDFCPAPAAEAVCVFFY